MSVIQDAIRTAKRFTAGNVPGVAVHLAGNSRGLAGLEAHSITLEPGLMRKVEGFLEQAGVPVTKGFKVLESDAAAETLVLTANGLAGTGKEVVVKLTAAKGVFEPAAHLPGKDMLLLDEPLLAAGVQKTFDSALGRKDALLVRVERKMQPVDHVIDGFAASPQEAFRLKQEFTEAVRPRVRDKGLVDVDLKANNFAIEPGATVKSMDELLARADLALIDVGAVKLRDPAFVREMAKPVHYTPTFKEKGLAHIDELFMPKDLPALGSAQGVGATPQALKAGKVEIA